MHLCFACGYIRTFFLQYYWWRDNFFGRFFVYGFYWISSFFSPLPVSVCKLSISCNSVFPLFFGVEKLICFNAMHLAPSIYQDLTVSWWNVFVFVWIGLTHEVLTNFIGYMGQRRSSWSKKNSHFRLINTFFTPYAVIVLGVNTIPEVPYQAISLS